MKTITHYYLIIGLLWTSLLNPMIGAAELVMVDFALAYSEQVAPNTVIIPFTLQGGLILVNARIGEGSGKFILDTGANGLVLNTNYVQPDRLLADIKGRGISGEMEEVGSKQVATFGMEELRFTGLVAQTVDLQHLEETKKMRILGLIGYKVLQDFELMINYQENYLTLSRVDKSGEIIDALPHTLNKIDSIEFTMANFLPVIEVQVDGKTKRMGIDSGAEFNLLDIKRSKDILSNFKIMKKTQVIAANDQQVEVLGGRLYGLSFRKKFRNPGMNTVLTNFKHIDNIYKRKLDGILGYPFLMRWITSLNYKKKKIYIHQPKFVKP